MLWLKACPKCQGDLAKMWDQHGEYIGCLQCGYLLNELQERQLLSLGHLVPSATDQEGHLPTPVR